MHQNTWSPPRPIRWSVWLAIYVAAITINKKYCNEILEFLGLNLEAAWQVSLFTFLPAVLLITILLILRCIWYQIWLIYYQHNQFIYDKKIKINQQYWSESILLDEVIFRCGQLNNESELFHYYLLDPEARNESVFESMSKEIPLQNDGVVYSKRSDALAAQLAEELKQRHFLNKEYAECLWLWIGKPDDWSVFREQVIAKSGYCPLNPDRYMKIDDFNWLIDRFVENKYTHILLLGIEHLPDFEMYLAMIFAVNGKKARIQRRFSLNEWNSQKDYFTASLNNGIVGFQLESNILPQSLFHKTLQDKGMEITVVDIKQPAFFDKLNYTTIWMRLLLSVYQLQLHSYAVILQENEHIISLSQVNSKK